MSFRPLSDDGFYGWINVATASVFMFTITIVMQTFPLFLPEWVKDFNWKYKDISFAMTINLIVMSFVTPLAGFFVGKYGPRISMVAGSILTITGIFVLANVHSLWHLYIGNGVLVATGVTLSGMLAITTLINNWFSVKRSISLSIPMAAMGVSGIIITPAVPWMIIHTGWRSTYLAIIPVYFLFALLIPGLFVRNTPGELGQMPDGPKKTINQSSTLKQISDAPQIMTRKSFTVSEAFKTHAMWLLMIFNVLNWIAMGAIMAHGYSFLTDIDISPVKAGWIMGIISGVTIIGELMVGFLGLKYDMQKMIMLGCAGMIISYILMIFAAHSLVIVYSYAIFGGMGLGINLVALMNLIPEYFGAEHFPKIMGFTTPLGTLLGSTGAPLCGYIRDVTGSYVLFWKIAAVLMIMGLACLFFARPPVHPSLKNKVPEIS